MTVYFQDLVTVAVILSVLNLAVQVINVLMFGAMIARVLNMLDDALEDKSRASGPYR